MVYNAGLKVGIMGEAEFKRGIRDINGDMRMLRSELRATDLEFGKNDKSVAGLTARNKIYAKEVDSQRSKVSLLSSQHSKQCEELDRLGKSLDDVKKAHGEDSKEVEKAQKAYDAQEKSVKKLESSLTVATSTLNRFEQEMSDNTKELALQNSEWTKLSQKLDTAGTKLQSTGDKMQSMGRSMTTGITAPIVALGTASVGAFKNVDEGMDTIVKKTGATGDSAKELEEIYKDLGSRVPDSLNDVGAAIGEVNTRLEFTGEKLTDASEDFLKFARINDTDVNSAIQLVSRAMGDAGIESEEYNNVLDMLTVAAQKSGISIESLTTNLTKYGAPMRALGFDTETSIAIFAGWEKAGVTTETAFAGMKKAISNWAAEGKDSREEFEKTLKAIEEAPDIAEATTLAIDIFGQRAGPDLADAIQGGRFEIEDYITALENSEGAVKSTYEQVESSTDDAKVAFNKIKIASSELGETVLDSLVPTFEDLADAIQKAGRWYRDLDPQMRKTILTTTALVAGIGPLIFIVGKVVTGIGGMVTGLATASGAIAVMTTGAAAATPAIAGMASTLTFLAGPVGIAIVAVAGLTAGLGYLAIKHRNNTVVTEEAIERNDKFASSVDNATVAVQGNIEARNEQLASSQADMAVTQELIDQLFELTKQESLSAEEKEHAKVLMDEINGRQQALTLEMDEYSGSLNYSKEQVQELLDKELERIEKVVAADLLAENMKDQYKIKQELKKALEEENSLLAEQEEKVKAVYETYQEQANIDNAVKEIMEDYAEPLQVVSDKTGELKEKVNDLNVENADLHKRLEDPSGWKAQQDSIDETGTKYEEHARNTDEFYERYKDSNKNGSMQAGEAMKNGVTAGMIGFTERMEKKGMEAGAAVGTGLHTGEAGAIMAADKIGTETVKAFEPTRKEIGRIADESAKSIGDGFAGQTEWARRNTQILHDTVKTTIDPLTGEMTTIGSTSGANLATELDKKKVEAKWAGDQLYLSSNNAVKPIIGALSMHGAMAGVGFHDGIRDQKEAIGTQSDSIVQKVLGIFKSGFGIASRSKEMYKIGGFTMDGFLDSIIDGSVSIMGFIDKMLADIKDAFAAGNFNLTAAIDFVGSGAAEFFKSIGIGGSDFGSLVVPVTGGITSGYGYRESPTEGASSYHQGIDIGAAYGAIVGAAGAGTISKAGWYGGYGNTVIIDHGNGLETLYGHLSAVLVSVGQIVKQLEPIGLIGSTGISTGAHLHFGVMQDGAWVDPSSIWGYEIGTRYVPRTTVAMVHEGEMIVPKPENPYANSGGKILPETGLAAKQPLVVQVMLKDGRVLAENIVEDINELLDNKYNLNVRGMA